MKDKEIMKQAADVLRSVAQERDTKTEECEKLAADNEIIGKELNAFKTACQLAADGQIDVSDIVEKVAFILDNGADELKEKARLSRLVSNGIGTIKTASNDSGESDALTSFLYSIGGLSNG